MHTELTIPALVSPVFSVFSKVSSQEKGIFTAGRVKSLYLGGVFYLDLIKTD